MSRPARASSPGAATGSPVRLGPIALPVRLGAAITGSWARLGSAASGCRAWFGRHRVAREAAVVVPLGAILAVCALWTMLTQATGPVVIDGGDALALAAAGLVAAVIVRVTVLLHRQWKAAVGRFTAAAALCAVAAVVGTLIALIPSRCPGELLATGRCGVGQAAGWGQVAGLAALVNFLVIGLVLMAYRGVRNVLRDAGRQGAESVRKLSDARPSRTAATTPPKRRDPREPKGRPTARRADAEAARRKRVRDRT